MDLVIRVSPHLHFVSLMEMFQKTRWKIPSTIHLTKHETNTWWKFWKHFHAIVKTNNVFESDQSIFLKICYMTLYFKLQHKHRLLIWRMNDVLFQDLSRLPNSSFSSFSFSPESVKWTWISLLGVTALGRKAVCFIQQVEAIRGEVWLWYRSVTRRYSVSPARATRYCRPARGALSRQPSIARAVTRHAAVCFQAAPQGDKHSHDAQTALELCCHPLASQRYFVRSWTLCLF